MATPVGPVPRLATRLRREDRWGAVKVRWGIGRMSYTVDPGLYAVGTPRPDSPVLVTANYKLTVDTVRETVAGLDAWLLVLDTSGVNVWCAAGKGTFGTGELVRRVEESRLSELVSHRRLVLPQLGAPGVAGHEVAKATGFRVVWGPVEIAHLSAFLKAGRKAAPWMRRKRFPLRERAELVPMELVPAGKILAALVPVLLLAGGVAGSAPFLQSVVRHGVPLAAAVVLGVVAGAVVTPLLLPWLPGRAFAVKGLWPGVVLGAALAVLAGDLMPWAGRLEAEGWVLVTCAVAAFVAMNFTGSSTYTSLSGVRREMRWAVPLEIVAAAAGLVVWTASFVLA